MEYKEQPLVETGGGWYFEDPELAATHDPSGPNQQRCNLWMERKGASECTARICLGKVLWGRAHTCAWMYGPGHPQKAVCLAKEEKRKWFDHRKMFWLPAEHRYILTTQPYNVSLDNFKEMELFAAENGLEVNISIADAWWYPGLTPLIIWQAAPPHEQAPPQESST